MDAALLAEHVEELTTLVRELTQDVAALRAQVEALKPQTAQAFLSARGVARELGVAWAAVPKMVQEGILHPLPGHGRYPKFARAEVEQVKLGGLAKPKRRRGRPAKLNIAAQAAPEIESLESMLARSRAMRLSSPRCPPERIPGELSRS